MQYKTKGTIQLDGMNMENVNPTYFKSLENRNFEKKTIAKLKLPRKLGVGFRTAGLSGLKRNSYSLLE